MSAAMVTLVTVLNGFMVMFVLSLCLIYWWSCWAAAVPDGFKEPENPVGHRAVHHLLPALNGGLLGGERWRGGGRSCGGSIRCCIHFSFSFCGLWA
jgi:hypothetical protein